MGDSSKSGTDEPKADEIDPELIKLPRPKTRVRPITALAIVAICLTLTIRLLSDLQFSRQPEQPAVVAGVSSLSPELENRFIEIEVTPDRPQALRVLPDRKKTGMVLVPTLGNQGKLWLLLESSPWNEPQRTDERYQGRLTRLDDLDFDEPLRQRLVQSSMVARPIELAEIRKVLASGAASVRDVAGDPFTIDADTKLRYDEIAPNRTRILAVGTDRFNSAESWKLALQNADLWGQGQTISSTPSSWTFEVSGSLQEVEEKLVLGKLFAAKASAIHNSREGSWSELALDGDEILLGHANIGFRAHRISLVLSPLLDKDAYVLNTTENPGTYWYVPLLFGIIALLGLVFGWGLYRRLREG